MCAGRDLRATTLKVRVPFHGCVRNDPQVAVSFRIIIPGIAVAPRVNPYVLLAGAIVSELIGTTALKLSDGLSNPLPSIGVFIGYGLAFYLVSVTMEDLPIGVVYGTWAALGIVGVAAIGVIIFNETIDLAGAIGILLILTGVYCVNILSAMSVH